MKKMLCLLGLLCVGFCGCATKPAPQAATAPKPTLPSREKLGKLEITATVNDNGDVGLAMIYVDDGLVGTLIKPKHQLFLQLGPHALRIELKGYKTFQQSIQILGEPNSQALRVQFEK